MRACVKLAANRSKLFDRGALSVPAAQAHRLWWCDSRERVLSCDDKHHSDVLALCMLCSDALPWGWCAATVSWRAVAYSTLILKHTYTQVQHTQHDARWQWWWVPPKQNCCFTREEASSRRGPPHLGPDESGAICRGEALFSVERANSKMTASTLELVDTTTSAHLAAASAVTPTATGGFLFFFWVFGLLCHHTVSNSITTETHTSGAQ